MVFSSVKVVVVNKVQSRYLLFTSWICKMEKGGHGEDEAGFSVLFFHTTICEFLKALRKTFLNQWA